MRHSIRTALALGILVAAAGCARNVGQHAHTGKDGRYTGAVKVPIDGNAAATSGIVTYPGGDRVDWKLIELPAGAHGSLDIELKWKTPRPGLDLAFDVYTPWGDRLGGVDAKRPSAARSARKTRFSKKTTVAVASDAIYVAVYASQRGDAGRYDLAVTFTSEQPMQSAAGFDELLQKRLADKSLVIPDPPRLASVSQICTNANYDASNPDCGEVKPACDENAPNDKNPACKGRCPDKTKPDAKILACKQYFPECDLDPARFDKTNPQCDGKRPNALPPADPVKAKIQNVSVQNGKAHITITIDENSKVAKGWTGTLTDAHGVVIEGGEFIVAKVRKRQAFGAVSLSLDTVNANMQVVLYPPADEAVPQ